MYGRYRNGRGNGFRSNTMATGSMGPSRISPEGSFKGRRMHNHEHGNYNRGGYARGGSKLFQPPRVTSIFVEAGKLAAEYLVSKGVLPPNALSGKLPLDDLRNLLSHFPGFKSCDAENPQNLGGYSRSHSGNSVLDEGREMRNNGSEVRKLERSISCAEKGKASPKVEAEADGDDASVVNLDGHCVDKDGNDGIKKSPPGEIMPKVNESHKKSGFDKSDVVDDQDLKSIDAGDEFGSLAYEDYVDLAKQCRFVNLPTKTRSSLKTKGLKKHQGSTSKDRNVSKGDVSEGNVIHVIDVDADTSSGNVSPHLNSEQKMLQPKASKDPTLEVEDGATLLMRQGQHLGSNSFSEGSLLSEDKKPGEDLSRLASLNSRLGGKRAFDDETDQSEGLKKFKACDPIMDCQSSAHPQSCSAMVNQSELDEPKTSHIAPATSTPDHKASSCETNEEKLLFPGSSKTCNLNHVGTSDLNGNLPHNKIGAPKYDIEIIDLEDESVEEDKTFGNPEKRGDTAFTDLDSFTSNVHNENGMSDGYGLMISELLGNESPSCSSGILGDDESIYMSLGPLSILGPWEQSRQDYGKQF